VARLQHAVFAGHIREHLLELWRAGDELDAGLFQVEQEVRVAAEAVEFRNDQLGIESPSGFDGLRKGRPRSVEGGFNQVIGAL